MKVKYKTEDFVVEEVLREGVIEERSDESSPFAIYLIRKRAIDTLSVMFDIAKKLRVPRSDVSSCGLKDKYAIANQYVAVRKKGNLPRKIEGENWSGELIGFTKRPLSSKDILRNIFSITLRDIHPDEIKEYEENIKVVSSLGFPNYFDEQRFGSARHFADDKTNDPEIVDFIGKRILFRDWEGALKIHFQALSDNDRSRVKKFKRIMREKWRNWAECLVEAQDRNDIEILRYLVRRPTDFKGAFFRIEPRLARLYLEVYQDYIFNSILSELVKRRFQYHYVFPYIAGNLIFPYRPDSSCVTLLRNVKIPLPHKEAQIPPEVKDIYQETLSREKISLHMFDTGNKGVNFVKSIRSAWEKPDEVRWKIADDEYHQGMNKIELSFSLRPGTFATIFIKNITPLKPKSQTEKKPIPTIYDRNGNEISLSDERPQSKEAKKLIIPSRSTS